MIKTSVIVPVYNPPLEYFKKCLDSLKEQTLKLAEFIIVFDGESPEAYVLCQSFHTSDSRFKLFTTPHQGVSCARNFGIDLAGGEYVAFVDADDTLYSKTILEDSYQAAKNIDSDVALFTWSLSRKIEQKIWVQDKDALTKEERIYCLKQLIHIQNPSFSGASWAKIFRREFLLREGILFSNKYAIGEDRVFNYKAFSLASKISYNNILFYNYTERDDSASKQIRPNYLSIALDYIEELNNLSEEKYLSLVGRETLLLFYLSWDKDYMCFSTIKEYYAKMRDLSAVIVSDRFQKLISFVDLKGLSFLIKMETFLFQKKIVFPIWIHGIKRLLWKNMRLKDDSK